MTDNIRFSVSEIKPSRSPLLIITVLSEFIIRYSQGIIKVLNTERVSAYLVSATTNIFSF